ncbi:MAG: electron transfer flavoprotein-ubiquinone oxidoreductase [Planctomycetaceae bacterium]|nr:electron transfer flavoprotein-ubiquinone oxidoreductase [Planctomycetaceae bacterium]
MKPQEKPVRQVSWQAQVPERESMEVDVLVLGAGPAGLACAIALKRELEAAGLGDKSVMVLEKAEEVGYHILSGAVMDPRGIAELFPDWKEKGCPYESEVKFDCLDWLRAGGKKTRFTGSLVPPTLHNHGNYIVSLYKVTRWLKDEAEKLGIEVFPGFAGAEILFEGERVLGVQTRDAGIDRKREPKGTFQPGMNILAGVTVFAEGTRGSLAKHLIARLGLQHPDHPQTWGTGIKEIWEIPAERGEKLVGHVIHTAGAPLSTEGYGGGWIYGQKDNKLSIGFVVGLSHHDAKLDPHALFVQWKQHPAVAELLAGGKVVRYGAKTIPYGGYFSMPKLQGDGFCIVGDSAGFLNSARLKGIHLAIKSGMLAAEAIAGALKKGDTSGAALARYTELFEASWAKEELWKVRNFHQAFDGGMFAGMLDAGVQMITGGRGLVARRKSHRDCDTMRPVKESRLTKPRYDDTASMDKLTDVYWSGAIHEEDQPAHLVVTDPSICVERCTQEYGNPCQHFCPAAVYEWPAGHPVDGNKAAGPVINFSNCVHCKTCDIADPYQVIEWIVPEAGGGPKYIDM